MKKLVLASSLLCAAFALKADLVLCWTTPDPATTTAIGWWGMNQVINSATDKAGNAIGPVVSAKLGYFTDSGTKAYDDYVNNTASYALGFDEETYTAGSSVSEISPAGEAWSVIDANYYYYIALFNESGNLVAYSQTFNSAQVASSTFDTADFNTLTSFSGAFTGSGYAVPEPTSGLLVLLGMAGLALRRKKNA